jgi:hypothetical protein
MNRITPGDARIAVSRNILQGTGERERSASSQPLIAECPRSPLADVAVEQR